MVGAAALLFVLADWQPSSLPTWLASRASAGLVGDLAKWGFVLLLSARVALSSARAVSRSDWRWLTLIFLVIASGDTLFLSRQYASGIAVFVAAQLLLAVRHGRGLRALWHAPQPDSRRWLVGTGLGSLATVVAIVGWLLTMTTTPLGGALLAAGTAYVTLLFVSVWMSWLAPVLGVLPRANAWLVTWGIGLFFCCDISVAMGKLASDPVALLSSKITWLFYGPALWLPALSGTTLRRQR